MDNPHSERDHMNIRQLITHLGLLMLIISCAEPIDLGDIESRVCRPADPQCADEDYDGRLFSFVRWHDDERLIVVSNFDSVKSYDLVMTLPGEIVSEWQLDDGRHALEAQVFDGGNGELIVDGGTGTFGISLGPLESVIYRVGRDDAGN